jgi:hypothetical protein
MATAAILKKSTLWRVDKIQNEATMETEVPK